MERIKMTRINEKEDCPLPYKCIHIMDRKIAENDLDTGFQKYDYLCVVWEGDKKPQVQIISEKRMEASFKFYEVFF